MSRGKAFLFGTVIKLHLFSCAFHLSLWKRSQVHRLNARVIHGAPFPARFSAPGNKSRLSLVSEVEKLTVPFRKKPPFVPTLLLMTQGIMEALAIVSLFLLPGYIMGCVTGLFAAPPRERALHSILLGCMVHATFQAQPSLLW